MKRVLLGLITVILSSLPALAQPWSVEDPKFDALPNATVRYGTRPGAYGGAYGYRLELPKDWNGDLVMYAHGFSFDRDQLVVANPQIRTWLIQNGFAWAASSYSANGWAVRQGADETRDLALFFSETVAKPRRIFIIGKSMGGNIVTDSLGNYPTLYAGAMPLCGALTGLELFDYYLAYAAAGELISGVNIIPNTRPDIDFYLQTYFPLIVPALGTPGHYTAKGKQFDSVIKYLSGGERPYRIEGLNVSYGGPLSFYGAWFSSGKPGIVGINPTQQIATNESIQYRIDPGLGLDETALNHDVKRIKPDSSARITAGRYWYGIPSGRIFAPVLTYHTTGDAFVPVVMEQSYRQKVNAMGNGNLLVQRLVRRPEHCQFTDEELIEGFSDLVKWVDTGIKPKGEDVLADISNAGLEWTKPLLADDPARK